MHNRREFLAAALAAGIPIHALEAATPAEEAATTIERLRSLYSSLNSYVDITTTNTTTLGVQVPGEIRTAFAAPGRLCMQAAMRGRILTCTIIDGDSYSEWKASKGWEPVPNLNLTLAGLHGAGKVNGLFPEWLVLLLFDKQRAEPGGLRKLADATCTFMPNRCAALRGSLDGTRVTIDLDQASGAISGMRSEATLKSMSVSVQAQVNARLNAQFDIAKLIDEVRLDPEQPMAIKPGT